MIDKGYEHPLYSLDLVLDAAPMELPRHGIRVAQGLLVVAPALWRRAASITPVRCMSAISDVLANHDRHPEFARFGFDAGWGENMRYWMDRMAGQYGLRTDHQVNIKFRSQHRALTIADVRRLWARIGAYARLAGLGSSLTPGRPRSTRDLRDALRTLEARTREPAVAPLLARVGFGTPEQDDLKSAVAELDGLCEELPQRKRQRRAASDELRVIIAALCGDMARFCIAARHVGGTRDLPGMRIGLLLGRKPRQTAPVPKGQASEKGAGG